MHYLLVAPQKKINQQNLNHGFFAIFRVLSLPKKNSTIIYLFWLTTKFSSSPRFLSQVLKKVFRGLLSNRDIQWMKCTERPHNHTKFYVLGNFLGVRKWQNSSSGSDKTKNLIYKVPFTLHTLVELIHNSTNAKEHKKSDKCLQKTVSKLVLALLEYKKLDKR